MGVAAVQNPDLSDPEYGSAVPRVRTPECHGKFRETGEENPLLSGALLSASDWFRVANFPGPCRYAESFWVSGLGLWSAREILGVAVMGLCLGVQLVPSSDKTSDVSHAKKEEMPWTNPRLL